MKHKHLRTELTSYIRKLSILTVIYFVCLAIVFTLLLKKHYLAIFPFIILYFYVFNILQHYWIVKASLKTNRKFYAHFGGWFFTRMLINIGIIVLYFFIFKNKMIAFVIFFTATYFFFMTIEISAASKFLKKYLLKEN